MIRSLHAAFLGLLALAVACGQTSTSSGNGVDPTAVETTVANATSAKTPASTTSTSSAPPVPAELAALLKSTEQCEIQENGLLHPCPPDRALEKYVESHASSETFDACLQALGDVASTTRVLAASCLAKYTSTARQERKAFSPRLFDAVLPAVEKEKDPKARGALARALDDVRAVDAKREKEVLAVLEELDAAKEGVATAELLHTFYWFGMTEPVPKGAIDFALLQTTATSTELRHTSYDLLSYANDRAEQACPLLGKAVVDDDAEWSEALGALVSLECDKEVSVVNPSLVKRLEKAAATRDGWEDRLGSWGELRGYVKAQMVGKTERDAIAAAADKVARGGNVIASEKDIAKTLASEARGRATQ
ncbi:MAG: hypothetical protein HOW73_36935 [Polyangiaceae bacterium]|nr:hypothetical protein [Polyangiaceae bacterium]